MRIRSKAFTATSVHGLVVACMSFGICHAQPASLGAKGVPHSKEIVIMYSTFPDRGDVRDVGLSMSRDGVGYEPVHVGVPRSSEVLWNAGSHDGTTTVVVPIVGAFGMGEAEFLFQRPETVYLKLHATFRDPGTDSLDVVTVVHVERSTREDETFVRRIGESAFLQRLLGEDAFAEAPEGIRNRMSANDANDYRALIVIGRLLEATRLKDPQDVFGPEKGTPERALVWADTLWPLAKKLPDSSYAPYAAFYAGMSYFALASRDSVDAVRKARVPGEHKDQVGEFLGRAELLTKDDRFAKGAEALQFAVDRGDAYLKPYALYHLGSLRARGGQLDAGEELFTRAMEVGGERGTVGDMVGKLRSELQNMKQAIAQRHPNGQP
jgi:hypothetical protein